MKFDRLKFLHDNKLKKSAKFNAFLSYSHKDKKIAYYIFDLLTKNYKLNIWIDKHQLKSGNTNFGAEIQSGLKNSHFIICLVSKNYVQSKNCVNEFKTAKHLEKKVFLIILENNLILEETLIGYHVVGYERFHLYKTNDAISTDFQEFLKRLLLK